MNENENQAVTPSANPYAAPTTTVITATRDDAEMAFIPEGRVVGAGRGASWVGEAWDLFKKNPGIFIACIIIQFVIVMILNVIPFLGWLLGSLAAPIFAAGWIVMGNNAHNDEPIEIGQFFAGLQNKTGELFTVAAIYLGLTILLIVLLGIIGVAVFGTALLGMIGSGGVENVGAALAGGGVLLIFVFMLIAMVGSFLLYATTWFAPALVLQHNVAPVEAMKKSFFAALRNWLPFVVFSLVAIGLSIASIFTLFLGLVVVFPLLLLASYTSYRDIFIED